MSMRTLADLVGGEFEVKLSGMDGNRWEPAELWGAHKGRSGRWTVWFHRKALQHQLRRTVTPPLRLWNGTVLRERTLLGCSCGRVWVQPE
jgi:hypothetical protein